MKCRKIKQSIEGGKYTILNSIKVCKQARDDLMQSDFYRSPGGHAVIELGDAIKSVDIADPAYRSPMFKSIEEPTTIH